MFILKDELNCHQMAGFYFQRAMSFGVNAIKSPREVSDNRNDRAFHFGTSF